MENLEEGKIIAETKGLLYVEETNKRLDDTQEALISEKVLAIKETPTMTGDEMFSTEKNTKGDNVPKVGSVEELKVITKDLDTLDDLEGPALKQEELVSKLEEMADHLANHRRDASDRKLEVDQLRGRMKELENTIGGMEREIEYYEGVMHREGLVSLPQYRDGPPPRNESYNNRGSAALARQEAEQIQEAAHATVKSMKTLLDEKNRDIEKLRQKVEELSAHSHKKSFVDKKAEDLLRKLDADERSGRNGGIDLLPKVGIDEKHFKSLLDQNEAANEIIEDKDKTISQLEQRLLTQSNQRERAENRCALTLEEMKKMKADMITLVQQLKESEERCVELSKPSSSSTSNVLEKRIR